VPTYLGDADACLGCERCVRICPGLAITLVDRRGDPSFPIVTIPSSSRSPTLERGLRA
jgi:sarcosine oxidase, subunit alpha